MPTPRFDILAVDVDGTLLDSRGALSNANADAVRAATAAGVMVVLASARPPMTTLPLVHALGLDHPARKPTGGSWPALTMNQNGAVIWSMTAQRALGHYSFDKAIGSSVIAAARSIDPDVGVSLEHIDRWYTDCEDPKRRRRMVADFEPHFVGPVSTFTHIEPTRITLMTDPSRLPALRALIVEHFVHTGQVSCRAAGDDRLEIQELDVDKRRALDNIARSLAVPRERICAVGDGPNDAGMLRFAGLGLAVANAWGEARQAADLLLDSGSDDSPLQEVMLQHILNG